MLSWATLVAGTGVLASGGAACVVAGGASWPHRAVLLAIIWSFFAWRCMRVTRGPEGVERERLRRRGLVEAALAAVWFLLVAALRHGG